ncbi:MAG: hypothetical protein JWQ38_3114, partial [Flavipsychrobacter sp.]|nr:hypothetical protein [Flavipsychrobacter sp.]
MEGSTTPAVSDFKNKNEDSNSFNLKWLLSTVLAIWP